MVVAVSARQASQFESRLRAAICIAVALAAMLCHSPPLTAEQTENEPADLILHHGQIVTVDPNFTIVEALAVRGERIAKVGGNDDVLKLRGPRTTAPPPA